MVYKYLRHVSFDYVDFLTLWERKELPAVSTASSWSHSIPISILDGCRLMSSPEEDKNSAITAAPGSATDTFHSVPVGVPVVIPAPERLKHLFNDS